MFKILHLRNTERSGTSIRLIADGPYAKHVQKLQFKNLIQEQEGNENKESSSDVGEKEITKCLPERVYSVLSSLGAFPSLCSLSIEFGVNGEDRDFDYWRLMGEEEVFNYEGTLSPERELWKATLGRTFDAVAMSKAQNIKDLELIGFTFMSDLRYKVKAFRRFLRNLRSFQVRWMAQEMQQSYLDYLDSLEDLTIKADRTGPFGCSGPNHHGLRLNYRHMEGLKFIFFDTGFIDQDLPIFLAGRGDKLEGIVLIDYYATDPESNQTLAENGVPWHTFFDGIREARMQKLRNFEVHAQKVPLTEYKCYPDSSEPKPDSEEVLEARKIMASNPSRRAFPYGHLDDKYGMLFEDGGANLDRLLEGTDQQAWDRLQETLQGRSRVPCSSSDQECT